MRSEKQIRASRTNGARSKGPVTAQGKRNSCRNNFRHGFAARDHSLDTNPPAAFLTLKAAYMAELQPTTDYELHLVHTMAVARWRTGLVREAEKRALDRAMARQKANSADPMRRDLLAFEDAPELRSLMRYQIAFQLQFHRAFDRLAALAHSKSALQAEKNLLVVRTQEKLESKRTAHEAKPKPWVPRPHNLGFSQVPVASTQTPTLPHTHFSPQRHRTPTVREGTLLRVRPLPDGRGSTRRCTLDFQVAHAFNKDSPPRNRLNLITC